MDDAIGGGNQKCPPLSNEQAKQKKAEKADYGPGSMVVRPQVGCRPGQYIQSKGEHNGPDEVWNSLAPGTDLVVSLFSTLGMHQLIGVSVCRCSLFSAAVSDERNDDIGERGNS